MNTVSTKPILAFAGYCLDARRRLLIGPDGTQVNIPSRAFETLYHLASHPHELVPKQRLMEAVWPNSAVEENNLNQQISTLRKLLGEAAGEHRFIVTITGQGYRFVQDVRPLDVLPLAADGSRASSESAGDDGDATDATGAAPVAEFPPARGLLRPGRRLFRSGRRLFRPSRRLFRPGRRLLRSGRRLVRPAAVGAAAVVVLLGAVYGLVSGHRSDGTDADLPSIAVLPFANLSPNREQDYFADGLSEELLTALGRLNGLRVIGRTSSFSFKGKNEDIRRVGTALGVQHVLEGSVRRDGDRLRITAQLVDTANGTQLWAETYDRTLGDVFAIQREIADSVAATLRLALRPGRNAAAAGGTRNVEAYEAYLAARAVTNDGGSTRARDAIGLLEHAVQLDPDFALAWAALAEDYMFAVDFPESSALPLTPLELEQRITKAALRAFELAPDAPETLLAAGMVSMQHRDWAEAERRLRRAVDLAGPHNYDANLVYALFLMNVGRASDAIPYEERAMRAEPLLLRPVAFLAALYEMRGKLDKAEALLLASTGRQGQQALRREGRVMIYLARHDVSGLERFMTENGLPCDSLDNPSQALVDLRRDYADLKHSGAHWQLVPVALYASFYGDQALSLDALRAMGPTQNLNTIWRPALREVRRQPGFEALVRSLGLVDYWQATGEWGDFCRETGTGGFVCS